MKKIVKDSFLMILGGILYVLIEILWRGYSHISMFFLGGVCFLTVGMLNEFLPWELPIEIQALSGGILITILEFLTGLIVNVWLGLGVWNYTMLPLNVMGQICLPFTLVWILLSFGIIFLDDWIRYRYFHEEKPHYISIFIKIKRKPKP